MFNIKVYDEDHNYKFTQNPQEVGNDLSYTANTNGGQGNLTIEVNVGIDQNNYTIGDFVEIMEYNDNHKAGRDYYKGIVQNINLIAENNQEKIEIELFGEFYLLNKIIYQSTGRTFTKTDDPQNILNDIISYFNTKYPLFTTSIPLYGSNISIKFDNNTCYEAINLVCEKVGWYWYIGSDGVLVAGDKPTTPTHYLTYKKDIQNMRITLYGQDAYNKVYVDYTGGSITAGTPVYPLEKVESKTDIQNSTTATEYGNSFLSDNGVKTQVNIEVNNKYDIGSIQPGHTIKVRNSKYQIDNLQILKVSRSKNKISLDLDNVVNLGTLGKIILQK